MLDASYHSRRRARQLADPERRRDYELARSEIEQSNSVIRALDELREEMGLSKSQLARDIDRNDAAMRRFFTADVNPEFRLVAAVAARLGAHLEVVKNDETPSDRAAAPA
jgi:ribosome-binding protein aMBF1 (putative translation factor)